MSDLLGGGPSTSAGNTIGDNNGSGSRAQGATGSPSIRGPRIIMQERKAREDRRKAEQEARDRSRAEEEARLLEEDKRRSAERRAAAGAAASRQAGEPSGQRVSDNSQRSERRPGDRVAGGSGDAGRPQEQPLQPRVTSGRTIGGGEPRPRPAQAQSQTRPAQPGPSAVPPGPSTAPPEPAAQPTRSSFPHAFERWETLSAHWEGLTSFWIRRLEENSNEINRDPLSQQLSRQVTDLSAAGANLFHAVVELQRLRASSERKFQRWFFETREEQERSLEMLAKTERELQEERRGRAAAIAEAVAVEKSKSGSEKVLAEMRRELEISKQEARRAWEELGRREQEERERTMELREGRPILISGVQVVPMMQGVPSRHGSGTRDIPPTREGPTSGARGGNGRRPEGGGEDQDAYQQYSRAQRADPADPFVEQTPPQSRNPRTTQQSSSSSEPTTSYSPAPAVQPAPTAPYQQRGATTSTAKRGEDPLSGHSEAAFSEEEYEIDSQGQFVRDGNGNKIRYQNPPSEDGTEDYEVTSAEEREQAYLAQYGHLTDAPVPGVQYGQGPTSGHPGPPSAPSQPGVDYSGADYGAGPGWESFPRHHHPTRLSDVLEEDERSRTSVSIPSGQQSRRET